MPYNYVSVVCSQSPKRLNDMLGYMYHIVRASHRFKWPSWVVYDQNLCLEAADNGTKEWARIDPSLHTQCFMGQARSEEAWCRSCHSLDHNTDTCPLKPPQPKCPKPALPQAHVAKSTEVFRKYNRFGGDCHFGAKCKYVHACSVCSGPHPASQCSRKHPSVAPVQKTANSST